MRILHILPSLDRLGGGPSKSVSDLAVHQALFGMEVTVFTKASENPYLTQSPHPRLKLKFVGKDNFKNELKILINNSDFDVLHGHGVWQMPVHYMASLARKLGILYIVTPRGMLEPWALNAGKWKKKLAMLFYQRKDLQLSSCIHATATIEAQNIKNLGFTNPIAVIPNGINIEEFPFSDAYKVNEQPIRTVLYLSRIHPKKGIEILVEAWLLLSPSLRSTWKIIIAGNGDDDYMQSIKKLISSQKLNSEIEIVGPKFGKEKLDCYLNANLFVLPTYSENFGVVIAEALACGVPVITTKGAPWEDLNSHKAGWWIEIGAEPLAEAFNKAMNVSDYERFRMGKNGRSLVENKYTITSAAKQMIELYKWLLIKGDKPEFIY